jgi:hypothetical protein
MVKVNCIHHGSHEVEPVIIEGGLAITPWLKIDCTFAPDRYAVTHIASGARIGHRALTLDNARHRFNRLLNSSIEWRQPEEKLLSFKLFVSKLLEDA